MGDAGRVRPGATDGEALARALRASELRYRALIDAARDGQVELRNGRVVHANPAMLAILGLKRMSDLVGRPLLDHVLAEDRERAADHLSHTAARARGEALPPVALRLLASGGRTSWVEFWARPMDHSGAPTLLVGVRDGGERLRLQRALEESERLASLGALAAGVAHDAANPLSYALLGLEWLAEECEESTPDLAGIRSRVREALDGVRRVTEVVDDLRAYAAAEEQAPSRVLVPQALETALSLALHRLRHHARVNWERGRPDLATLVPEGALVRLLVDLLVIAGRVFERPDPAHNRIQVRTGDDSDGPWVEIESRAHLRALTPVLPGLVRHAIRNLGARLAPTTNPDGHYRLRRHLPRPPADVASPRPVLAGTTGPLRVVLVDDEPLICRALSLALDRTCDVTTFTEGQAALDHFAAGEAYDVVLLDVMMDAPAGPEIWAWLRDHRPGWLDRVVFITAGAATETARQLLVGTRAQVVSKPIDLARLRKLVQRVGRGATAT